MTIAEVTWKVVLGEEEFGGGAELKARVVTVAGLFVAFSLCLSFYLLFQHLSTYNVPSVSTHFNLQLFFSFLFFRFSFGLRESNAAHFLIINLCRLFAGAKMVDRCYLHGSSLCYLLGNPKNSLLSFSLQSFTNNANFSVIRVILNSMGLFGRQLVVPYVFPVLVLQSNYR